MEALILSCGTGGGHDSAGHAVERELLARGHSVTFLDPYDLAGAHTSQAVNNTYISVAQKAPHAFGAVYALGDTYRRLPIKSPVYHVNQIMAPVLENYLQAHPCDCIVSTHLFPAEILTSMKKRGLPLPFTCFIATDYTCIPFTEETDCDRYVIPSPELVQEFAGRGIPREKLVPLGIPVGSDFTPGERAAARRRLGFAETEPVYLVAGGSIGAGSVAQAVEVLLRQGGGRVVVCCGNNRRLYEKLRQQYGAQCDILDYTDRMADHMRACDVFITKPGGLSSTEAANVGTALILMTPIPGCETHNLDFFARSGMCLPVEDPRRELPAALAKLSGAAARRQMLESQRRCIPRHAARHICDLLEASARP